MSISFPFAAYTSRKSGQKTFRQRLTWTRTKWWCCDPTTKWRWERYCLNGSQNEEVVWPVVRGKLMVKACRFFIFIAVPLCPSPALCLICDCSYFTRLFILFCFSFDCLVAYWTNLWFLDFLQTIVRTKENIEKKHALTYDEIVKEREEVYFKLCKSANCHPKEN